MFPKQPFCFSHLCVAFVTLLFTTGRLWAKIPWATCVMKCCLLEARCDLTQTKARSRETFKLTSLTVNSVFSNWNRFWQKVINSKLKDIKLRSRNPSSFVGRCLMQPALCPSRPRAAGAWTWTCKESPVVTTLSSYFLNLKNRFDLRKRADISAIISLKMGHFVSIWENTGSELEFQLISRYFVFSLLYAKGVLLRARTADFLEQCHIMKVVLCSSTLGCPTQAVRRWPLAWAQISDSCPHTCRQRL